MVSSVKTFVQNVGGGDEHTVGELLMTTALSSVTKDQREFDGKATALNAGYCLVAVHYSI